jgi:hypothetical protein
VKNGYGYGWNVCTNHSYEVAWPGLQDLPMWVLTTILLPSPLCHSEKNQIIFFDLWSQCNCRPSFISILLGV